MLLSKFVVWMFIFVNLTEAQVRKDKLEIENILDIEVIFKQSGWEGPIFHFNRSKLAGKPIKRTKVK